MKTDNTDITFAKKNMLGRSDVPTTVFTVENDRYILTYLGAAANELCDYFVEECVARSDAVIFGSCGPKYKIKFNYYMPHVDGCVFLGNSEDFASKELLNTVKDKEAFDDGYPVRFKLTYNVDISGK